MITIRQLEPPATARRFSDNRGYVFFDLPAGLELRTTKTLDRVGELGRITQEAALSVNALGTPRNRAMLAQYEPDVLGRLKGKFSVEVLSDGDRTKLTAMRVLSFSESEGYELEVFGDDWQEDTEQVTGKDLEYTPFTWTRQNVVDAWDTQRTRPAVVPGLAHYGGWFEDFGINLEDLRLWFNIGELLRSIFCAAGWSFTSPHFDEGDGRWWYAYLSGEFWHTYSTKFDPQFEELLAAEQVVGTDGIVTWTDQGVAQTSTTHPYFLDAEDEETVTMLMTVEVDLTVTLPPSIGPEVPLFYVVINTFPFRGRTPTEVYREQHSGGEVADRVLTLSISEYIENAVSPYVDRISGNVTHSMSYQVVLIYETSSGPVSFMINSASIRYRPDPRYYVTGDTILPGELINPDLNGKDIIEAVAHLVNAKFVTDYGRRQVVMHTPYDYQRVQDGQTVAGFFQRNQSPVDMRSITTPGSFKWSDDQQRRNRYRRYDFADGSDSYIEQNGGRQRFGRTVDLGIGLNETDNIKNPLFEPTALVAVPKEQTAPSVINPDDTKEVIIPALWNNADGEISHDLGPRICVWYGPVLQGDENDPNWFYLNGQRVDFVPLLAMLPAGALPPDTDPEPLAFSGYREDLFNRHYRNEVLNEGERPPAEILLTGGDQTYEDIDFRKTILIEGETGPYELQPTAVRDHPRGSNVPLLVEGRIVSC